MFPRCCFSNCQRGHYSRDSKFSAGRWCMYAHVHLVPFIFQCVQCLLLLNPPSLPKHASTTSWAPASSIWCRLWPCSMPGSRTLTAKALLCTDELSEPSPSCVWYRPCLRLPSSIRAWSPWSTLPLYLGYKSEAAGKRGKNGWEKCEANAHKEAAEVTRLWWKNPLSESDLLVLS